MIFVYTSTPSSVPEEGIAQDQNLHVVCGGQRIGNNSANLIKGVHKDFVGTSNRVLKNASWIIVCRIAQSLVALVIGMITARYLGPSNYGLLNYASSVVAFAVPLAQLGLRNVLVEEIISHPEREGKTLGTSLVMSVVSSLLCIIGCVAFVAVVNAGERETLIVCALYSISLVFQMTEMIQYWYQAKLLSKYTSLVSLAAYTVVALYKVFLLVTGKSIYWFAVSYAFDFLIISVALLVLYQKLGNQKLSFSVSLGKQLFFRSKYYIISSMMVTVFAQTDKIMIKMMIGNAENGYYSTAIACAGMTGFVFVAVIDSLRPVIFESKQVDYQKFEQNMSILYSVILHMGLIQSLLLTLFAKPIVSILYGEAYLAAIPLLQIITWYSAFSYMGSVRNIWMLAEEKQKYLWIINLSGAVLNVVGNFILIPLMGAAGAAIASVATQFFTNFILCLLIKPIRPTAKLIMRALDPRLPFKMLRHK
ncbi:MAG: flippase [Clostridia bacterium]|nr:flippase [Clostridia bacterium]